MNLSDSIMVPGDQFPPWRTRVAHHRGTQKKILLTTWGGLGDQVCAEPTLRYALDHREDCSISLWTEHKSLFDHLPFDRIYDDRAGEKPDLDEFLVLPTIVPPTHMAWQYFSHCLTHCVDFPSICALRQTLPTAYKAVKLAIPPHPHHSHSVVVHPGRHWESKTFPVTWWRSVIDELIRRGIKPVLVGRDMGPTQGYVNVSGEGCHDLRDKTTADEFISILRAARVIITNDSVPIHIGATGGAFIAFIATAKHQDYLYHWRRTSTGEVRWAYNMQHYNKGGLWDSIGCLPNKMEDITVDRCTPEQMMAWLPQPKDMLDDMGFYLDRARSLIRPSTR